MNKRDITDSELSQIIKLKQGGASWLRIQEKTSVPRRSAKRAYEDWGRRQSVKELKTARSNVATEAFRNHVESLLKLGWCLIDTVQLPQLPGETRTADQVIDNMLEEDITGEIEHYPFLNKRKARYSYHQNTLLLNCLRQHTTGEIDWHRLDIWKRTWDNAISDFTKITDSERILAGAPYRGTVEDIQSIGGTDLFEQFANSIPKAIWLTLLDETKDLPPKATVDVGGERAFLLIPGDDISLDSNDNELVKKAVCLWDELASHYYVINVFSIGNLVDEISTIKKSAEEFNRILNPLVLRPIILRTRCELCPA